ncbi:MAG TPA: PEGA domain-containing protein, partial [Thermoplasmatales archaeon]|nr:PEGA domain-containing protein [Thermoplasmatales archaeon]
LEYTPITLVDGGDITVNFTIRNTGGETTCVSYTRLYIDNTVLEQFRITTLPASISYSFTIQPGTHNITVKADVYDDVEERDENDNIYLIPLPYVQYSDIAASHISIPRNSIYENEVIEINTTISNIGGSSYRSFIVELWVDDSLAKRERIHGLEGNTSTILNSTWIASAGSHNITLVVDASDEVAELDETNNLLSKIITIVGKPPGNLVVRILDNLDQPIDNAFVSLYKTNYYQVLTNTTDVNGETVFHNLSTGNYILQASATGYQYNHTNITINSNITSSIILHLNPNGYLEGFIRNIVDSTPIDNVTIKLEDDTYTVSDSMGYFNFSNITPGRHILIFDKESFREEKVNTEVSSGETTRLNILLTPLGEIIGFIRDTHNNPIENCSVYLLNPYMSRVTTTEHDGGFKFTCIPTGNYTLRFTSNHYVEKEEKIHVEAGEVKTIDITLQMKPIITGVIIDNHGIPIENTLITAIGLQGYTSSTYSSVDGSYTLYSDVEGEIILEASKNGYIASRKTIQVHIGDVNHSDFVLTKNGFIEGVVRDSLSGEPVENATIYINLYRSINTDENGSYNLSLPPGDYILKVSARGYEYVEIPIVITSGNTTHLNITLKP